MCSIRRIKVINYTRQKSYGGLGLVHMFYYDSHYCFRIANVYLEE